MNKRIKKSLRTVFEIGQKFNINILPKHFYSEIPDIKELKKTNKWKALNSQFGINGSDAEYQKNNFINCIKGKATREDIYHKAIYDNGEEGYGFIEAEVLYDFINYYRPPKVIQVGCGVSTAVILHSLEDNHIESEILCIDPFPTKFLKKEHRIQLIRKEAQNEDLNIFTNLGKGDLLFIDSTHTVKTGSEVNYLILEVLPRLKPGIFIHFHDIYFPYTYQRNILDDDLFFQNECVLLYAYLLHNKNIEIVFSLSQLHYSFPEIIKKYYHNYLPQKNRDGLKVVKPGYIHFPSSIYLKTL